jgi:NADPH-dependent 2,4-dienoyl-CoA reductase/sulfur reductase-like enzyme
MGAACAGSHADHGTRLLTGTGVAGVVGTGRTAAVELTDGTRLPADVMVLGIGATPDIEWLAHAGVALGNGVLTDARGATNLPGVVAVGDCAAARSATATRHVRHRALHPRPPATGHRRRHPAGRRRAPPAPVPYFRSDQYGARIPFTGTRREGDIAPVLEGSCAHRSFLAVHEPDGAPAAVLGMNPPGCSPAGADRYARPCRPRPDRRPT